MLPLQTHQVRTSNHRIALGVSIIQVDESKVGDITTVLLRSGHAKKIERDYYAYALATVNDPIAASQS